VSPARQSSAEKQFAGFLTEFTPDVVATARAALQRLRKQVPPAIELVYDNYNGLVVGFGPSMRASEAVLSLAIFRRTYLVIKSISPKRRPRRPLSA
jgi:hypothetical protein